jgi:phosphatidylinositol alpha 1,6-mannosyltransferase
LRVVCNLDGLQFGYVRVAIAAECFLPQRNGVTNSVLRILEHLTACGHEPLVITPGAGPSDHEGTPVARVRSLPLPVYRDLPVAIPTDRIEAVLRDFSPHIVHLAAPAVLGPAAAKAARDIGVPVLAVYQTDFAGFARRYGSGLTQPLVWKLLRRAHRHVDLTLAPSTSAAWQLSSHGIDPVAIWPRGVNASLFHPSQRSDLVRRQLAPRGEVLVGYVGRLASEKRVELLESLRSVPRIKLVVIGDGPSRRRLERRLPHARFLGWHNGLELAALVASLDVFVHTGPHETFCQAIQEAMASGVPVVAPAMGGPLDLVQHGENGWLFPPDASELMAQAVSNLAADSERREAMGERARVTVEQRTWKNINHRLLAYYDELLGGPYSSEAAA